MIVLHFSSDDATMIYVSVGFGFFVEFTHDEALRFIEKKTEHLTLISDSLTRDASRIKAHIKLVLEVSLLRHSYVHLSVLLVFSENIQHEVLIEIIRVVYSLKQVIQIRRKRIFP